MNKIVDENYLDLIIDNSLLRDQINENNTTRLNDMYSILHILLEDPEPCELGELYEYYSFPSLYTPMAQSGTDAAGVNSVQNNPYLALYGQGILVGVIDTGIDYRHPAFLDKNGDTRIVSIWDQSIQNGTPPAGFQYGTEYGREIINRALQAENPLDVVPTTDTNGHGTAIASIIAGSLNEDNGVRGIVTQAELVVVKLKKPKKNLLKISFVPEDAECYQETDIMLAMKYLEGIARKLRRPIAICFAFGSSQGSHSEFSTLNDYMDRIVLQPQIDITVAAGNEGNKRRHYFGASETAPYSHSFELKVGENEKLFALEIWSGLPARLSVKIMSPTGEYTRVIYPQLESCYPFSFIFEESKIWVNNITLEKENGEQLILIRFENPHEGIWTFDLENMEAESYTFHAWLPSGDLISDETYFLKPSPYTTITMPGTANNLLTVTAYDPQTNSILAQSGWGYTRDWSVIPDVTAPGNIIACAMPNGLYGNLTGTGAATAFTTGVIAMLFEWAVVRGNYTSITGSDVNQLIIRGADRSNASYVFPNPNWGYGILDIYGILSKLNL